jgi:hypothetical protein
VQLGWSGVQIAGSSTTWAYNSDNNKWHLVGFLLFSYHNNARSNKNQTFKCLPHHDTYVCIMA